MITDPDRPNYRYPKLGERLWHSKWRAWMTVDDHTECPQDEVAVRYAGVRATVKLRNLHEPACVGCREVKEVAVYGGRGTAVCVDCVHTVDPVMVGAALVHT